MMMPELDPAALQAARERLHLEPDEVGSKVGLSAAAIRSYERGHRTPKVNTLLRLAACYGVSVESLTTAEDGAAA